MPGLRLEVPQSRDTGNCELISGYNQTNVPKYSIVVPLHNEQENVTDLYDRLKAVMEASGETFEMVLVDDGSTDDTSAVIEPYLKRIKYIRQQNKGLPSARNSGIRAAQGEFIALLDADEPLVLEPLQRGVDRPGRWAVQPVHPLLQLLLHFGR